ncbi:reverse transcriptase domain-containing protein [Serratia nematodiphila]|uniref:reverse transcriptase domain-containing protein n=1 Tax=Serratia nematodiphila TaxID=458197 RepID=UPI001FD0363A|nr:reverse transcriptase domain-containing protein [Serratia nematodiphila]UTO02332.1 reverse transcriptase domain-containing protein [Serratia nematodiphila]
MQVLRRGARSWVQWCAQDALILKWAALLAEPLLPKPARCLHLRGHGGSAASVAEVREALAGGDYTFVYRTDIRGYYRHIRKQQVINQLKWHVADPVLFDVMQQYVHYSVEDGGEFYTPPNGICRGCALSPLIGGSLLHHVDSFFNAQEGVWYARYMDDFLLFTRTRWQLRRSVKRLHEFFDLGGFETHPDKTQLGRITQGFDWLGVWFTPAGAAIAPRALDNHRARRARLYEQARRQGLSSTETELRVRTYEARWTLWAERMLKAVHSTDETA